MSASERVGRAVGRALGTAKVAVDAAADAVKAVSGGAPRFPAGTTVTPLAEVVAAQGQSQTGATALPRDPAWAAVPFGPGLPMNPSPINAPIRGRERPEPRLTEYPVSWNLPGTNNRLVPWKMLRDFADANDVVRRCIEVRKNEMIALEWDIVVKTNVLEDATSTTKPGADAAAQDSAVAAIKEKYKGDIDRLRAFWTVPDKGNGLTFEDWLITLMEEHFVLDAVALYPRLALDSTLYSVEVIDGSTIKPLLDARGARPMPPNPAYQQILQGFPRGEFVASPEEVAAGEYRADAMLYKPRYRRSWTPYGFSNVEQALITGDLYMKRQNWMRNEYTEGVIPEILFKTDADWNPQQLAAYEQIFNDDLSGKTAERMRARLLPKGMEPFQPTQFAERYTADYDEFLIKLLCAHFDVMPTEIGFPPKGGLGGKGHQEGEENTTYRKAIRPTTAWLTSIVNEIGRAYLKQPAEIEFQFLGLEAEDEKQAVEVLNEETGWGRRTINEARSKMGLPLFKIKEADMPFIAQGGTIQFLEGSSEPKPMGAGVGPDGLPLPGSPQEQSMQHGAENHELDVKDRKNPPAGEGAVGATPPSPAAAGPAKPKPTGNAAKAAEARTFQRFASKRAGGGWRDFQFAAIEPQAADYLNKSAAAGDVDAVKVLCDAIIKADRPKVGAE